MSAAPKSAADKMYAAKASAIAVLDAGASHADLAELLAQLPAARRVADGEPADFIVLCAASQAQLEAALPQARSRLLPGGALWVVYRKGQPGLHRDTIRAGAAPHGLDTVAIVAVDADWSALRLKLVAG